MKQKISFINIESFRGIPESLSLSFWNQDKSRPCSVIIFGDNGTGKSSVVDAIEFCLQGRIDRVNHLKSELKASPISLKHLKPASIKIEFQDGSLFERTINIENDIEGNPFLSSSSAKANKSFSLVPIVLRRSDILKFNQTPSIQRQMLFHSYVKAIDEDRWLNDRKDEQIELMNQRTEVKSKRRTLLTKFATELKISTEEIPLERENLEIFLKEKVYGGMNQDQRRKLERKGFKLNLNKKLVSLAGELIQFNQKLESLNKEEKRKKNQVAPEVRIESFEKIFSDAEKYLTDSFKKISSIDFIDKIEMRIGDVTKTSLTIFVHLKNGQKVQPNNIFSEANLDLLALLIFLAIIKDASSRGQEKLLILDDVLQSIDSTIRLLFADFLIDNFKDWQMIFTVHDKLFLSQLKSIFRRHGQEFKEFEILKWNFNSGPQILTSEKSRDNSLKNALETQDVNLIASHTGVFLEKICSHLSYSLPISVVRKRDDKYNLGDLWPGIFKKLRKTSLGEMIENIDKLILLRNLFGSHYNEWALSLSNQEIFDFASSVLLFYENVFCDHCSAWIHLTSDQHWTCNCGKLKIEN